jgi:hypothetical protein
MSSGVRPSGGRLAGMSSPTMLFSTCCTTAVSKESLILSAFGGIACKTIFRSSRGTTPADSLDIDKTQEVANDRINMGKYTACYPVCFETLQSICGGKPVDNKGPQTAKIHCYYQAVKDFRCGENAYKKCTCTGRYSTGSTPHNQEGPRSLVHTHLALILHNFVSLMSTALPCACWFITVSQMWHR